MDGTTRGIPGTEQEVIVGRVLAFVVDHVLSIVAGAAVGLALAVGSRVLVMPGVLIGLFGYFIVLEGLWAQTVGKRVLGLVVTRPDGTPITFRQAVIRNVLRVVDGLFFYSVGLIVMMLNERRMRLGDHVARSMVVRANW